MLGGQTRCRFLGQIFVCTRVLFSLFSPGSWLDCSGQGGPSSGCPVLASGTLVPSASLFFGRVSKDVASSKGSSVTIFVSVSSSQRRKSSSFSMASFRQQGEEAGLSQTAQFSAEAQSTRDTYDARLDGFREWCAKVPCDPTSASLGVVADFLISLFDKGLTLVPLGLTGWPLLHVIEAFGTVLR